MKISIINGPNMNLLGKREKDIYGNESFENYFDKLKIKFPQVSLTSFQSNIEGEIVDAIQQSGFNADAIILNAGAYTHTSVAIGDAIAAIPTRTLEVHISNIFAREEFRKISHISAKAEGIISGLGLYGYDLAIEFLINK